MVEVDFGRQGNRGRHHGVCASFLSVVHRKVCDEDLEGAS
jgi:hypothetical protein